MRSLGIGQRLISVMSDWVTNSQCRKDKIPVMAVVEPRRWNPTASVFAPGLLENWEKPKYWRKWNERSLTDNFNDYNC